MVTNISLESRSWLQLALDTTKRKIYGQWNQCVCVCVEGGGGGGGGGGGVAATQKS